MPTPSSILHKLTDPAETRIPSEKHLSYMGVRAILATVIEIDSRRRREPVAAGICPVLSCGGLSLPVAIGTFLIKCVTASPFAIGESPVAYRRRLASSRRMVPPRSPSPRPDVGPVFAFRPPGLPRKEHCQSMVQARFVDCRNDESRRR